MTSATTLMSELEATPGLEKISEDIAALKRDLATLMQHAKSAAVTEPAAKIRDAVDHLGDDTRHLFGSLAEQGEQAVKAAGRQIEERPLASLSIAFAVGFLGGRLLSR